MHATVRLVVAAALLGAGPLAGAGAQPTEDAPESMRQAALIVDTGTEVKKVCARFRTDTISGTDLLTAAEVDPVFRSFPGTGAAVCQLCGTGCPADGSCLTCGGATYWSYWRAGAGSADFVSSEEGAGITDVVDGGVEGWAWADGKTPPPFQTAAQVCDDPAATTVSIDLASATRPPGDDDGEGGDRRGPVPAAARFGALVAVLAGVWVALGRGRRTRPPQ